jgi:hypothetical protein
VKFDGVQTPTKLSMAADIAVAKTKKGNVGKRTSPRAAVLYFFYTCNLHCVHSPLTKPLYLYVIPTKM